MSSAPAEDGVLLRPGRREDFSFLQALERDAAARFRALPDFPEIPDDVTPVEELEAARVAGLLWVAEAGGEVAGYAYAAMLDGNLHLEEVSVSREFGRRGIGRRLVESVIERARAEGRLAVTLTTFRDVPWNAPFYARLGFREVKENERGAGLREVVAAEASRGLPARLRVAMIHAPGGASSDASRTPG